MNKLLYPKLAASNISKNRRTYFPYIITCIITVAVFYIVRSLSLNPGLRNIRGDRYVSEMMGLACWIVGIFALVFLFYTNSFLMKRRRREFGLFNILGMEKRHISKVVAFESLYIFLLSASVGTALGIALDKLMFLLITKAVEGDIVFGFFISPNAIMTTVILFAVIFFIVFLNSLRHIHISKPIELLKSGSVGEKEPKSKLLIAILGIICLFAGYYISISTKDIISAITFFFLAVILVIIGTYFIFTSGSIALLKLLRRNKKYYYKTSHFLSVSGMIYRMKQNAVGLANICVLSTAVLVMLSSTTALMAGEETALHNMYPYEINVQTSSKESLNSFSNDVQELIEGEGHKVEKKDTVCCLSVAAVCRGESFEVTKPGNFGDLNSLNNLVFLSLDEYNRLMGEGKTLNKNEILLYSGDDKYNYNTLSVFDKNYEIKEKLKNISDICNSPVVSSYTTRYIVLPDENELEYINKMQQEVYGDDASRLSYILGIDFNGSEEQKREIYAEALELTGNMHTDYVITNRTNGKDSLYPMIASFFFLGIFLGTLFIMATILIIYYKQISEGYEDKERYEIMQRVGVSNDEIKKSIHSQILTVFFLPIITAGVHTAFAFPIITRLLLMFNLSDTALSAVCTVICFAVFALFYAAIYLITARSYYKIVSK